MIIPTTDRLYRGRPKSQAELNEAWGLGIRTIISLESGFARFVSEMRDEWCEEKEAWEEMGGRWENVPCSNFFPPSREASQRVYNLVNESPTKVLIHCFSDVDRTGWMCAYYKFRDRWCLTWQDAWEVEAVLKGQHFWFRWWRPFFWWACRSYD